MLISFVKNTLKIKSYENYQLKKDLSIWGKKLCKECQEINFKKRKIYIWTQS